MCTLALSPVIPTVNAGCDDSLVECLECCLGSFNIIVETCENSLNDCSKFPINLQYYCNAQNSIYLTRCLNTAVKTLNSCVARCEGE